MDITPIFRPPTPPKAGIFFLSAFFSLNFAFAKPAKKSEPSQFVIYFQTIADMSPQLSKSYIDNLSALLAKGKVTLDKKYRHKDFFNEGVFNRIQWNHFAIQINQFCNSGFNNTCLEIAKLRAEYVKKYNSTKKLKK